MKSKIKTKVKKKKMFGGLNKLPPNIIKKIANKGNDLNESIGAKITGTAKFALNNNQRVNISKKKNFNKLNNLRKKKMAAYYAALNQDRHDLSFEFLKEKKNIDREINKLKKKMSWKNHTKV